MQPVGTFLLIGLLKTRDVEVLNMYMICSKMGK